MIYKSLSEPLKKPYFADEESFTINFSAQRIASVGGQKKYQDYFEVTKTLYPAISTIEVIIRNRINHTLIKHSSCWLLDFYFYKWEGKGNFGKEITAKMKDSIEKILLSLGAKSHDIAGFWKNARTKKSFIILSSHDLHLGFG